MSSPSSELVANEIVRAGAGAGKTTELTNQVLNRAEAFYAKYGEMPKMIVTTFTRKATQELRERLMVRALASKNPHLIEFVNSKSYLYVSTIHGVLEMYLKRYGAPLAIDPNFIVLNRTEAAKVARKALREVMFGNLSYQEMLETFDFKKLTHLCRQFHELKIRNQNAQRHDLQSLYAALQEMSFSLVNELNEVSDDIVAEANGPKADEWMQFADKLKTSANLLLKSGDRKTWQAIRAETLAVLESAQKPRANSKNPVVSEETSEKTKEVLEAAKEFIEANAVDTLETFAQAFLDFEKLGTEFSNQFMQLKREQGAIEISDLELLAGECIRREPKTALSFSQEWDHWLIDEYQDTSPFQVELLDQLVGERPVFIVGDPQQSIYLFRGARFEVFARACSSANNLIRN